MVDFKYKVTDIAKDFGISTKKVIETFAELTGETRKTGATFEENEVNALMEALTRETAVKDLGEYLASGKEPQPVKQETKKPEAKPQAKKEAPKPEAAKPQPKQPKQPEAPKAEPKAEQAKPAQNAQPKAAQPKPVQQEKRNDKRNDNKQAEKRSEKRVTMQELASETGIKEPVATEQVKVDRAQVSVDTRTVDVNVDKFSARYDDLADSRNMPSKRKNAPTGKKEKFNNRNNRRGQQFGRRRETEDQGGGIKIDHIGSSVHFAHLHELGNNLGHILLQAGSQLANGDLIGDGDLELGVAGLFQRRHRAGQG